MTPYIQIYVIIGPDKGLLPYWCQASIWTNADISSVRPSDFNEILFEFENF